MPCPENPWDGTKCPVEGQMGLIIMDELTTFPANPMVIANDPRKDISKRELTENDKKYQTAAFRDIRVNGWPLLTIVSSQKIEKGDEITIYYGPGYVLTPDKMVKH